MQPINNASRSPLEAVTRYITLTARLARRNARPRRPTRTQVRNPAKRHLRHTTTRQSSATQSACVEHGVRERRGHPYQRATHAFSTPTPLLLSVTVSELLLSRFACMLGKGVMTEMRCLRYTFIAADGHFDLSEKKRSL